MAQIRTAQEQQRAFAKSQEEDYGPFGGMGATTATETAVPGVTNQNGQYMFKGRIPLSAEEYQIAKSKQTRADRDKFLEDLVKTRSKTEAEFLANPSAYEEKQVAVNGRFRDLDTITKRKIIDDAKKKNIPYNQAVNEYFDFIDKGVIPQGRADIGRTTSPRIGTQAIAQVETGGREGLVSPKGAMGVMQVMPNTNRDPGFGVTPAKDNSPAELKRVGEEYFGAMQKKYGNDTLAAIAYNMGPGAADAWIKKGGNFNALPKETRDYIGKVHLAQAQLSKQPTTGDLTTAPAETAINRPFSQPTKPISNMSSAEIKQQMEYEKMEKQKELAIEQAGGTAEMGERGKEAGTQAVALQSAYSNAPDRLNSVDYVRNQMKNTDVIGILSRPTVAAALGTLLKEGFDVGSSKTSVTGLDQAIAQAMKGSRQEDIDAMINIGREFAKMELTESRNYLKGQGAVSDAERRLITRAVANIGSSPNAINDFLKLTEMRASFDNKAGDAWEKFRDKYPKASYDKFVRSEDFRTIKNDYSEELKGFTQSTLKPKDSAKGTGTTPNKTKWSIVQ